MSLRFQADADLNPEIGRGLRRLEPSVDFRAAAGVIADGTPGPEVLRIAAGDGCVLISRDITTMPRAFGILECRQAQRPRRWHSRPWKCPSSPGQSIYNESSVLPKKPKIYHITHLDNLPQIVDGVLWSDAERIKRQLDCKVVGMTEIKRRRLQELEVDCHRGTKVGEYVPFYFCPRSIMLFLLHKGNHSDLTYTGGQRPIVHLQADLHQVIDWANSVRRNWAFSNGNAGTRYTQFFNDVNQLDILNWDAIAAIAWKDLIVRERKQAEFLVSRSFPWELIERIGAFDNTIAERVSSILSEAAHAPEVLVAPSWYY